MAALAVGRLRNEAFAEDGHRPLQAQDSVTDEEEESGDWRHFQFLPQMVNCPDHVS